MQSTKWSSLGALRRIVMSTGQVWNERYKTQDMYYGDKANDFLRVASGLISPQSQVLSLGEGEGRNALFLAHLGHQMTCIDASSVAQEKAQSLFARDQLSVDYQVLEIGPESFPQGQWDAVIAIWFHVPGETRALVHQNLSKLLKPGGIYICEGYTPAQMAHGTGGPKDLNLLYDPPTVQQELAISLELFQSTERFISEGVGHHGTSATLQIVARNV